MEEPRGALRPHRRRHPRPVLRGIVHLVVRYVAFLLITFTILGYLAANGERPMTDQKPSVGRIVHYVSYGTPRGEYIRTCRAAIVTETPKYGGISLCVLNPTGMNFVGGIRYDDTPLTADQDGESVEGPHGGTWHWPERV